MNPNELQLASEGAVVIRPVSPDDLLNAIIAAARDPGVDVEKMERLVNLHERITARQAEAVFNEALRAVQAKIPPIVKSSRNPSTNSSYAKFEHIQDAANPILFEHGFSVSYGTDQSSLPEHYGITALLSHNGGHSRLYRCDVPTDTHGPKGLQNKTKTHGFGSAVSYGERYLLGMMLNIRLIGTDDDGNRGNIPKPQGPSSIQPTELSVKDMAKEAWSLLRPVRGSEKSWQKANEFCWRNDLLDGGVPEELPNLSQARFETLIAALRSHPELKPV